MKIRDLVEEIDEVKNPPSEGKLKDKLHLKLKDLFSVIQHYEESGEIRKEDTDKIDTFKQYVKHFIEEEDRKNEKWVWEIRWVSQKS